MRSLFFLTIIVFVGLVAGCYSDDDGIPTPPQPVVGSVEVWMERDTVHVLYGDSALVEGYVSVRDTSGNPVPHCPIHLSLTESIGRIEFTGPQNSTTNSSGFVYFRFCSYNQSGIQTIVAECQDHADAWTFWLLDASEGDPPLSFTANRAYLSVLPGRCDSVRLVALVVDGNGQGVPDTTVTLHAPCGTWQPFPPTGQAGRTETWWRVCDYGWFILTATCGYVTRSLDIFVEFPVNTFNIWLPTDTVQFLPGDTATVEGWVQAKDQHGCYYPGVVVQMSLAVPLGFIRYLNPALRDTTDENGRVSFAFITNQPGVQIITAECGYLSDSWMLFIERL
ncbi:MAG: Ig-like domain-containing protein [bacterium]|nr:Ig-like domain-containing protein [bacterium]